MDAILWYPGHELLLADVVRAGGSHLFDAAGRRFVDLEAGVWCAGLGHAHPRIVAAIRAQLSRVTHTGFNYSCGVVEETARELLALLGFTGGRCVLLCSGSEAVEYGVRGAQALIPRPVLLTMADSYFGAYGAARRRPPDAWYAFDWTACAGCPADRICDERCPHWAAIPRDRIGGLLFEPGSSSGLVRFPPAKLIRALERLVREAGGLVLVNEVTTGMGRTGAWFGFEPYGLSPDIVALGKGIGNGYPVSATAFAPGVIERLGERGVPYAQSHQNDPLGAAVAREVIRVIREGDLIARGREIGALLAEGLERARSRSGRIREIRGRGLMFAIEFADDSTCSFTGRIHRGLFEQGFLVGRRPGQPVLRLDPALTIEREDIEGFVRRLDELLWS